VICVQAANNSRTPVVTDNKATVEDDLDLEAAKSALDELFLLARHYRDSAKFRSLIEFVARFRRYSAFNAMLVHIQMPGAVYVLPAKRWLKEYRRVPSRDAQPLVMLQPRSPVMFGFDVSQTEGDALPPGFANPFETDGLLDDRALDQTMANARRDGLDVQMRALGSTLGGYVSNAASVDHVIGLGLIERSQRMMRIDGRDIDTFAEIVLNRNLAQETNYATLVHELGHLYCGHVGTPNVKWWPDRRKLTRNAREFEAESVSYLVCRRAGIHTPAVAYLHGYLDANAQVPEISLDVVFKAAHRIESMRKKSLPFREADREQF
jgi:hypothetical protein